MKKTRYLLLAMLVAMCFFWTSSRPDGSRRFAMYAIAFYNVENLFDTLHDVRIDTVNGVPIKRYDLNDYEYLPDGANNWNSFRYSNKVKNMSDVLSKLATDKLPMGPALIGLSEVENARVLQDLLNQPSLKDRGWKYIHVEGPDRRGVDCAFLYNPKFFKLKSYKLVPYVYQNGDTTHFTRGFLVATGELAGEELNAIVCHWPSRASTSQFREWGGAQVKVIKDSIFNVNPNAKIIVMGDLNDDPDDKSLTEGLGAKRKASDCGRNDMWNPWWDMLRKQGVGSLKYDGKWNLFDQIVISGTFLNNDRKTLEYYNHEVFNREFLIQQEGQNKGYPKRTFSRGVWTNGYSDHLPTIVYFVKEVK